MDAIFSVIYFLASLFIDFYVFILLLRLLFQKFGASWHNSISQFVIRLTEPVIRPLRRFIPGFHGFDLSIVFIAIILELIEAALLGLLRFKVLFGPWSLLLIAFGNLGLSLTSIYMFAIILNALMSWFPLLQNNALGHIVRLISEPVLRIFRRFIPPISGMDLSPLFALISLYIVKLLIFTPMIEWGARLVLKP